MTFYEETKQAYLRLALENLLYNGTMDERHFLQKHYNDRFIAKCARRSMSYWLDILQNYIRKHNDTPEVTEIITMVYNYRHATTNAELLNDMIKILLKAEIIKKMNN